MPDRIDPQSLAAALARREPLFLLDVREDEERDLVHLPDHLHIPLHQLPARKGEIRPSPGTRLVVYCHHGMRSLAAAEYLARHGFPGAASLDGGIDAWAREIDPTLARY